MDLKMSRAIAYALLLFVMLSAQVLHADTEWIPFEDVRVPSDDLVHPQLGKLSSEHAWQLKRQAQNPLDLSLLNPQENDVWRNKVNTANNVPYDQVSLNDGELVRFEGLILSNSGLLRFNVLPHDAQGVQKFFTIGIDKTIHTTLLRKNLLRKLGYIVPPMKYLKKIAIEFPSVEDKQAFVDRHIPEKTLGAPDRWVVQNEADSKIVVLQDVVAFSPSQEDHYNLAMGVPPKVLTSRVLRSLIIPYAMLDLGESVNKFNWLAGREANNGISLPHSTYASFNATYDDAIWMMRRLIALTRADIEEVVKQAYYPVAVEKVLIEKLLARRNSLIQLFKLNAATIAFDEKPSYEKLLKEGKLTQQEWPGYAARFAHGDPESPFQDIHYFFLSKLQAAAIDNLIGRANQELMLFDLGKARARFQEKQFKIGLDHFVETGEFIDFGVGTWVSPILNGSLILSRDIVVGFSLGTDNLVQLADTFGYSVELGVQLGLENLPNIGYGSVTTKVSAVKTWSHLKPVKTLKATFKEPYQNIIVPLVKMGLMNRLGELEKFSSTQTTEENQDAREKELSAIMVHLNKYLGVGESLIMTERLSPQGLVSARFSLMQTNVSMGLGWDHLILRRVHLYRKDASTIQVHDDNGRANSVQFTFSLNKFVPIIRFQAEQTKGKYSVKVHEVNINHDLDKNPDLFKNANALQYFLKSGSTELLSNLNKPFEIATDFKDKATRFGFLAWRSRYLDQDSLFTVTTPKGGQSKLMSLRDASQQGINYEDFAREAITYAMNTFVVGDADFSFALATRPWVNPAYSLKGKSETVDGRFESRLEGEGSLKNHKISDPFISIAKKREGWGISKSDLKSMVKEINKKYGTNIFDENAFNDLSGIKLYELSVNLNLYQAAIDRIEQIDIKQLHKLKLKYIEQRAFRPYCRQRSVRTLSPKDLLVCGHIDPAIRTFGKCKETWSSEKSTSVERGRCYLKVAKELEAQLEFSDFQNLIGKDNYYLYGLIQGFQEDSEILRDPIKSNTSGSIGGPYWDGPVEFMRQLLGVQNGEFKGFWLREVL